MKIASRHTIQSPQSNRPTSDASIDAELVERFKQGDDTAFLKIMERHQRKIFAKVQSLLHNHADAEEITQDTFIRALRGLDKFRGDSSLATWLYRIAVNLARNRYWYFFRRRRQDSLSLDHALGENNEGTFSDLVASEAYDPAQETASGEFVELINVCLKKLDKPHRDVLTMRNVSNMPYDKIAKTLHIKVGTVKSRIARARESMRKLMAESCPEFAEETAPSEYFISHRPVYGSPTIAYA